MLDVVFLVSLAELPNCVIKQGVWNNPFMHFVVKPAGFIENSANAEVLIDRCANALNAGEGLIIFPEGTRTNPNGEMKNAPWLRSHCIALTKKNNTHQHNL